MKFNAIAEAMSWLPGFGPGEDPLELSSDRIDEISITEVVTGTAADEDMVHRPMSIARIVRPVAPPKQVWPSFDGVVHPSGVIGKVNANIEAIELLKRLESDGREPTEVERVVLTRYTGWGGLPKVFMAHDQNFVRLREAMEQQEYEAARASVNNAHYTPPGVIKAMWDAVRGFGFKGGRVLEPAAGTGYFIGYMPQELAQASSITAVEIDPISARLTQALYGPYGVRVLHKPFEEVAVQEGFYDLVISNVPFGDYGVHEQRSVPYKDFSIHNYFIAKSLEAVRPGGILAVVTSTGTMDSMKSNVRRYLAVHADLLGAIRLPEAAFHAIANTDVTTDVLFFQRRECLADETPVWVQSDMESDPVVRNPYYLANPANIIGTMVSEWRGTQGRRLVCKFDGDLDAALAERVACLPKDVYTPRESGVIEIPARQFAAVEVNRVKPGSYLVVDGKLHVQTGVTEDGLAKVEQIEDAMQRTKVARIRDGIDVRDAARKLVTLQATIDDEEAMARQRKLLNLAYDAFVKRHGFINATMNQRALRDDPDFPLLLSLEIWDDKTKTAEKAEVFHRRTVGVYRKVEKVGSPAEALVVSMTEFARVVPARIGELLGCCPEDAVQQLQDEGLVFQDPESMQLVDRDLYLSGNVRTKLAWAREAGPEYANNVASLLEVIPKDLDHTQIAVKMGSTWVPSGMYTQFCREVLGNSRATVSYNRLVGSWDAEGESYSVEATQTWGTARVPSMTLVGMLLNQQTPQVTDRDPNDAEGKRRLVNAEETIAAKERQEKIKEAFAKWIWESDERRESLVRIYNDTYNATVNRKYDGKHLTLPGFSNAFILREHQLAAVWRTLVSPDNVLFAHAVGAGKTLEMICAAMEARRTGFAAKPLIAVPNHMLEQFAAEFLRAYPSASVLMASKEDMEPQRRAQMLAKIAYGDWDAVVITHASFEKIKLPFDASRKEIQGIIQEITAAMETEKDNKRTVKQLERAKKVWAVRLEKLVAESRKDDMLDFAEIGVDMVLVDEAHLFKNLFRFTRLQMPGLPTNDSFRAFDMYMKTRFVMNQRADGRGVVFATGTPIANSVAEMWVMQNYLQPKTLARLGIAMFDQWAANFGEAVTGIELAPDGSGYRMHTRFARFCNVPELMNIFCEVADIRTKEMMNLPTPTVERQTIVAPRGAVLKAYVDELVERSEKIRNGQVDPSQDNMLKVTTDGRKAATDLGLVGLHSDEEDSKISLVARNVARIWKKTAEKRLTQVVFLDLGTPGSFGDGLYGLLKQKLVELGVTAAEVAFIHQAKSDGAKESLFESVRMGEVRVLIGSTSKMGVGTNIQNRLIALHQVDAPWRPADVEQREGRIERQGNLNDTVEIYRYVTEGSFDAYSWQTLETKAKFISQVMNGDRGIRSLEDAEMSALSFAEVKALASGNPLVIQKAGVDAEVMKLGMLYSRWKDQNANNRREVASLPARLERAKQLAADAAADLQSATELANRNFAMEIKGVRITDREEAGKRLMSAMLLTRMGEVSEVGRYGDFVLTIEGPRLLSGPRTLLVSGKRTYEVLECKSVTALIRRIEAQTTIGPEELADQMAQRMQYDSRKLAELRVILDRPFEQEDRYRELLAKQEEINRALGLYEADKSVVVEVAQAA